MNREEAVELLTRAGIPASDDPAGQAERMLSAVTEYRARQGDVVDAHVGHEFVTKDLDATMATMNASPYVVHVPTLTGGEGTDAMRRFYGEDFIPNWPDDTAVTPVCRTVGAGVVIDELIVSFTHDRVVPILYPGIEPTGRAVRLPFVVIVGVEDGKVTFERIYWDQASALTQIGLLNAAVLPVTGAEQADEVVRLAAGGAVAVGH
jgi:carboxymethylenebutenolidase